jgi:hypothetical protein
VKANDLDLDFLSQWVEVRDSYGLGGVKNSALEWMGGWVDGWMGRLEIWDVYEMTFKTLSETTG